MLLNTNYDNNLNFQFHSCLLFKKEKPEIVKYSLKILKQLLITKNNCLKFLKQETLKYCASEIPAYKCLKGSANWDNIPVLSRETFRHRCADLCNQKVPYDLLITSKSTLGEGGKFVQRNDLEFFLWDYYLSKIMVSGKKVLAVRFLDHFHGLRVLERSGGHETRIQLPFETLSHVKMFARFFLNDKRLNNFNEIILRGAKVHTRTLICFMQEQGLEYTGRAKVIVEMGSDMVSDCWRERLKKVCGKNAEIRETYGLSEFPMSNSPVEKDGGISFPINTFPELINPIGRIIKEPFVCGELVLSHLVPFTLRQPLLRYRTADLGFFDRDRRFHFQGRPGQTIYRKGLRFFGQMHIERVLDGDVFAYCHAEAFAKFSQGVVRDRTVRWPKIIFKKSGRKTIVTILLNSNFPAYMKKAQNSIEAKINNEILRLGLAPQEVHRYMEMVYKPNDVVS